MDTVDNAGGYPLKVRTDCGTENVLVASIQSFVHASVDAHVYGTSPGNQRIEGWWSFFRRTHTQFWIEHFEKLVEFGAFHPGNVHETDCLRYCYMNVVQTELNDVRAQWNTHRIRPSVGATCPAGIPDELYFLPVLPAVDQLTEINSPLPVEITDQIEQARSCEDMNFHDYLDYLCNVHHWTQPTTLDSACQLYFNMLPFIN